MPRWVCPFGASTMRVATNTLRVLAVRHGVSWRRRKLTYAPRVAYVSSFSEFAGLDRDQIAVDWEIPH